MTELGDEYHTTSWFAPGNDGTWATEDDLWSSIVDRQFDALGSVQAMDNLRPIRGM